VRVALTARVRPAAGVAEGALVLFHGRGADEYDLFPLLDALDPERRLVGATPRAPLASEIASCLNRLERSRIICVNENLKKSKRD